MTARKLPWVCILLSSVLLLAQFASADTVMLKNGDRLTGRVIELEDRVIVVTRFAVVGVPASEIQRIERDETATREKQEVIKRLQKILLQSERSDERYNAIKELVALKDKSVLPVLVAAICVEESNSTVVNRAADAILQIAGKEAPQYFYEIIWKAQSKMAIDKAIYYLRRGKVPPDALLEFCRHLTAGKGDRLAVVNGAYALTQLGSMLGNATLMDIALDDSASWDLRLKALEFCRYPKDERIINALVKLALDTKQNKELRLRALKVLTRFKSDVPKEAMAKLCVSTDDPDLQYAFLVAMGDSTGEEEMKALGRLAVSGLTKEIRHKALRVLMASDKPEALEPMCNALLNPAEDIQIRLSALTRVAERTEPRATEALLELCSRDNEELMLRLIAVGGLKEHKKEAVEVGASMVAQSLSPDEREQNIRRIISLLYSDYHPLLPKGAAAVLKMMLGDEAATAVRLSIMELIGFPEITGNRQAIAQLASLTAELGDAEAGQFFLDRMVEARDSSVKAALCRLVGAIGFIPATDPLAQLAASEVQPESVRDAALDALVELCRHVVLAHLKEVQKGLKNEDARNEMRGLMGWATSPFSTNFLRCLDSRRRRWLRVQVAEARERLVASEPFGAIVDVAMSTNSASVQMKTLQLLRGFPFEDERLIALCARIVTTSPDSSSRRYAIYALRNFESPEAMLQLASLLDENLDTDTLLQVIEAIRYRKSWSAVQPLIKLLKSDNERVAENALSALERITGRKFGRLSKKKPDERRKVIAAWEQWYKALHKEE